MSNPETNLLGYIEQLNSASINSGSGHGKNLKDSEESKESNKGPSCIKASNSKLKTSKSEDLSNQMIIREISENENILPNVIDESVEEFPLDYNNKRIKAYEVFDLILKTPFPSLFTRENEEIYEFECFPKKELKIEANS